MTGRGGLPWKMRSQKNFGLMFTGNTKIITWRTLGIFFIFSSGLGTGKGRRSPRRKGGGGTSYLEIEGGESFRGGEAGGAHRGWEGVAGRRFFFFFFSGPKCPPRLHTPNYFPGN